VRVLVAVAEESLLRILERGLHAHGFDVIGAESSANAIVAARDPVLRCAVIDWSPGDEGADALRRTLVTDRPDVPVIVLTTRDQPEQGNEPAQGDQRAHGDHRAQRDQPDQSGANDRLTKPFALEELIRRIRALTRSADEPRVTVLTQGDLRLDLMARCAWRGQQAIDLPTREFALLEYFMRHAGRVVSRQDIRVDVWGYDSDSSADSNVVDVYVRYVRRRITRPGEPPLIVSVRGEGYRFDAPVSGDGSPAHSTSPTVATSAP